MWHPLSGLFSLPVLGKRQMGTSVSPLARLELAGSRDPCSYPCMPLPTQVWVILQGDVLVFVHMLLAGMHPSGSVSLPSLQGGCEAGLAKWLGNYSDLLIFLPQPSQRLCSGWDIGSFLTPLGGQFTQPVYPACCQGSQAATMGCLPSTSVPTSGSHPSH